MLIDDSDDYLKRIVLNSGIGRKEIKVILKEAFTAVYEEAVICDPTFYTRSKTFSSSNSIAYPTRGGGDYDYLRTLAVRCTDSNCKAKGAIPVETSDWFSYRDNPDLAETNNDPIYRLKASGIELQPARAGIHYYLCTISESDLDNESTDVYVLIPRPFKPILFLKILELARIRHFPTVEMPSTLEEMLKMIDTNQRSITTFLKPVEEAERESPAPGFATRRDRQ